MHANATHKGKRRGRKPKVSRKHAVKDSNGSGNGVSSEAQNHAGNYSGKRWGRKPKGSRKHGVKDSNGSGNCVSSEAQNHAGNYSGKRRGRKPKDSRKHAVKDYNGSGNGMVSEVKKNAGNDKSKRRSKRARKNDVNGEEFAAVKTACFDRTEGQINDHGTMGDHNDTPFGLATKVKEEIEDYDDNASHIIRPVKDAVLNVEHYWHDDGANARKLTEYREKLMQELKMPYCQEEYERLLKDIHVRKPVQHHKELRGGFKIFEENYLGKSLLDHHIDLTRKINSVRRDRPRVLNLLRGYFYWLMNCSNEEAFKPWRDPYCLAVRPQR